jgi:hypothetical protein
MLRIRIRETFPDPDSVLISADGSLDEETISILRGVCERHWQDGREVRLDLDGLIRISREGMEFLNQIQGRIKLVNLPEFIRL